MRNPLEFVVKLFLYLCFFVSLAFASIVWKPHSVHFPGLPATSAISAISAVDVNGSSICGALHAADPLNGCSPLSNPAVAPNETNKTNFILMMRGQCNFSYKIQNAQAAGYHAAIIFANRKKAPLIDMTYPEGANVHAFYVTLETGAYLKEHARGEAAECCIFPQSYAQNKLFWKIFLWAMGLLAVISTPPLFFFLCVQLYDFMGRNFMFHLPRGLSRGGNSQGPSLQT